MNKILLGLLLVYSVFCHSKVTMNEVRQVYRKLCVKEGYCPKLYIVKNVTVNAYSTLNGIIIYTGMLNFLSNKEELALVLGHELGHVHNKDNSSIWHTYNMEYHADQYGANLMIKAGFNRCKGVKYFTRTMQHYGDYTSVDHPMDSLRLGRINYGCRRK